MISLERMNSALKCVQQDAWRGKYVGALYHCLHHGHDFKTGEAIDIITYFKVMGIVEQIGHESVGVPVYKIDMERNSLTRAEMEKAQSVIVERRAQKRKSRAEKATVSPRRQLSIQELEARVASQHELIVTLTSRLIDTEALLEPTR